MMGKTLPVFVLALSLAACGQQGDGGAGVRPDTESEAEQTITEQGKGVMQDALDAAREVGGETADEVVDEAQRMAETTIDDATAEAQAAAQSAAAEAMDTGIESAEQAVTDAMGDSENKLDVLRPTE